MMTSVAALRWPSAVLGWLVMVVGLAVVADGLVAAGSVPEWELAMVGVLAFGVFAWRRLGLAHPATWFALLSATYFLVGAQNWIAISNSSIWFRADLDTNAALRIPVIGCVSFVAAAVLTGALELPSRSPTCVQGRDAERQAATLAGSALLVFGLIGASIAVREYGVLLLHPGTRADLPGLLRLATLLAVPGVLLLTVCHPMGRGRKLGLMATVAAALASLGYRTPVLLMVGTYVVTALLAHRVRERTVVVVALVLVTFAAAMYSFRLEHSGVNPYRSTVHATGPLASVPSLTPLYYSSAREGVAVLNQIARVVPAQRPYYHGSVEASSLSSLLPGKQASPRAIVADLAYRSGRPLTSLTPTIVGGPYLDFGIPGVVIGMTLLGAIANLLYRWSRANVNTRGPLGALPYAYFATLVALSIHAGLLDAMLLILLPLSTIVAVKSTLWLRPSR